MIGAGKSTTGRSGERRMTRGHDETGTDHRDHRAGRLIPGGAPARQGVWGPWPDSSVEPILRGTHRPPLSRPPRSLRPPDAALRGPPRLLLADQHPTEGP